MNMEQEYTVYAIEKFSYMIFFLYLFTEEQKTLVRLIIESISFNQWSRLT